VILEQLGCLSSYPASGYIKTLKGNLTLDIGATTAEKLEATSRVVIPDTLHFLPLFLPYVPSTHVSPIPFAILFSTFPIKYGQ